MPLSGWYFRPLENKQFELFAFGLRSPAPMPWQCPPTRTVRIPTIARMWPSPSRLRRFGSPGQQCLLRTCYSCSQRPPMIALSPLRWWCALIHRSLTISIFTARLTSTVHISSLIFYVRIGGHTSASGIVSGWGKVVTQCTRKNHAYVHHNGRTHPSAVSYARITPGLTSG